MTDRFKAYRIAVIVLSSLLLLETAWIVFLSFRKPRPLPPKKEIVSYKGKIAIVIDDWGYTLANVETASGIGAPLTASILPNLPYSEKVASKLHSLGFEIILHLPLEPSERFRLEKDTILTSMDEGEVSRILGRDLDNLPFAKGVSNHMGSLATQDKRTMGFVFKELKKRNLYFFDSLSSAKSACAVLARQEGIGFAKRDIFLDNTHDPAYIRSQLYKARSRAYLNGEAIVIGHDRKNTLEVLKEEVPRLKHEGYRFVLLSELIHKRKQ